MTMFIMIINGWMELKGIKARGQASLMESKFSLDHILTLCTLIKP